MAGVVCTSSPITSQFTRLAPTEIAPCPVEVDRLTDLISCDRKLQSFALGVMSVAWMVFVAGLITFEKTTPWRQVATYATALDTAQPRLHAARRTWRDTTCSPPLRVPWGTCRRWALSSITELPQCDG